jgi:predicted lysophospholipase L1 biosynthesis ABC-type transport system permease subunit
MMLRLLAASLRRRGAQLLLVGLSVAVAAATVAALAGFLVRAGGGFGEELAAFGPNLTVRPQVGGALELPAGSLATIRGLAGVESAEAAAAAGGGGALDRIEVRARPDRLGAVAAAIEARLPGVEARPLLRVSRSERDLVRRVTWLLGAAALVTCLLALVSVGAVTTALVVERRREIGLLAALGFSGRRISTLFAAELLAAALAAAVVGHLAGEAAAGRLATGVLGLAGGAGASVGSSLPAAAAAAVAVVAAALAVALRRVGAIDPAAVLRGE